MTNNQKYYPANPESLKYSTKDLLKNGWDNADLGANLNYTKAQSAIIDKEHKVDITIPADGGDTRHITKYTDYLSEYILEGANRLSSLVNNNQQNTIDSKSNYVKKHLTEDNGGVRFAPLLSEFGRMINNWDDYLYDEQEVKDAAKQKSKNLKEGDPVPVFAKTSDGKWVLVYLCTFIPGKSGGYNPISNATNDDPICGLTSNSLCFIKPKNEDSDQPTLTSSNLFAIGNALNGRITSFGSKSFMGLAICIIAAHWYSFTEDGILLKAMGNIAEHFGWLQKTPDQFLKDSGRRIGGPNGCLVFLPLPSQAYSKRANALDHLVKVGGSRSPNKKRRSSSGGKKNNNDNTIQLQNSIAEFAQQQKQLQQQQQQQFQRLQQLHQQHQQQLSVQYQKNLDILKNLIATGQINLNDIQLNYLVNNDQTTPFNQNLFPDINFDQQQVVIHQEQPHQPSFDSQDVYDAQTQPFDYSDSDYVAELAQSPVQHSLQGSIRSQHSVDAYPY